MYVYCFSIDWQRHIYWWHIAIFDCHLLSIAMKYLLSLLLIISLLCTYVDNNAQSSSSADLVATLLADTPIEEDLQELCDHFGGRVTGTANNLASVEWGLQKFLSAGVKAQKESFDIPSLWVENGIAVSYTHLTLPTILLV